MGPKMVLAMLFLTGCEDYAEKQISGYGLVLVNIDDDFDRNHITEPVDSVTRAARTEGDAVRQALRMWDSTGVKLRTLDMLSAEEWDQVVVDRGYQFYVERSSLDRGNVSGVCWPGIDRATIYVGSLPDGLWRYYSVVDAVAHEMGHAMGLHHVNDIGRDIMSANRYLDIRDLSGADKAEFQRVWPAVSYFSL